MKAETKRRGLTLIELVVVLAIVGILASVVMPIFATQRDRARQRSCQSNLKQVGLGFMQYCRDYDEKFPRRSSGRLVWQQLLQPYVRSVSIFVCPANPAVGASVASASGGFPAISRSYGVNHRASFGDREISIAGINSPARKILVAESRAHWPDYGSAWWRGRGWSEGFAGHLGTANYLFADGHVKSYRPSATAAPFNMWGGMDGGVCPTRSINCDKPEPAIIKGLQALQNAS